MDINNLNFNNLSEIEDYINETIIEKNIACSLQLRSSMVLIVMTRKRDTQMTASEYELLSDEILNILNNIPNQDQVKSAQFYAREKNKPPEWRFVKHLVCTTEVSQVLENQENSSVEISHSDISKQEQKDASLEGLNIHNPNLSESNSDDSGKLFSIDNLSSRKSIKVYQCLNIRAQFLGRGITQEILSLYINGKNMANRFKTLHDCLNCLGLQGFYVVSATIETEGTYTHFYTLQRELIMDNVPPLVDIFDELDNISNGVSLEDNLRSLFEGGARFW